jgi:polyribonucleotide nucleotidyltransferase
MLPEGKKFETKVNGQLFTVETGRLAGQAGGAITLRVGDTMVFAAATMSAGIRPGLDFFPLTVDYEERMYAGGRIPGSFFRREGRPTEEAILTARLVDRPIRPLFPKDLRNEVQVLIYSFSADGVNPLDILAVNAASMALMISDIPWEGPIGAVRVGLINGQYVSNPEFSQIEQSTLDLRIAGTRDAILMVESGSQEITEDVMIAALEFGHKAIQAVIDLQEQMAAEIGKPKRAYVPYVVNQSIVDQVAEKAEPRLVEILERPHDKSDRNEALAALEAELVAEIAGDDENQIGFVKVAFDDVMRTVVRRRILEQGVRPDGRSVKQIRPIWCEVDISPRAHGSGLFTRGETQVLTLATLGTPRDAQEIDSLSPVDSKRYMHHYNFPPFSTGEVKPLRGSSRRDVGHGALAERALLPVIPAETEFPYTMRLVSEVLSSNGSSSMASVCGSTLALMDTGVPIKAPVAGVAMGLIKEGDKFAVLTDILGAEDHLGDMDFKVAGTAKGITALQMDIKIRGITTQILKQAMEQARQGRLEILEKMLAVISAPRANLKPHVPRMVVIQIPVEKIGAIIGPGGKMIRSIQEETGAKIDIDDSGLVFIASADGKGAMMAREKIESLIESAVIGRIYTGKVVRITDFGAFVEILPNVEGLVHISQLDSQRVEKVEDVVGMGDEITVMVTAIDPAGKVRLSRQAVLEGWSAEEAAERDSRNKAAGRKPGGGSRSGSRGNDYRSNQNRR